MKIKTFRFRQPLDKTAVVDPYKAAKKELSQLRLPVEKGQSVAITGSSRGITDIVPITRAVVDHFKELGADPFLVPAMGSHAGGTADSQRQTLLDYGLSEGAVGCPIRSSMETVQLGSLDIETDHRVIQCPVYFDRIASEADHVFLVNRIKSHTRFTGSIESGLLKMLMIGLGNADGASAYHRAVSDNRFPSVIKQVSDFLVSKISVLGGLGIVENGEGKTAFLKAIHQDKLFIEEEKLLALSKKITPKLPFEEIDLLFVRKIGKNISGTGMDTNVIGRKHDDHKAADRERPRIHCVAVLGLTPETAGNANGIGMAEFCLSSVLKEVNWPVTRFNAMTANHVSAAMIPLDYETEEEILYAAWHTLGKPDPDSLRVVWIEDTLHLEEIIVSESLKSEIIKKGFEILAD